MNDAAGPSSAWIGTPVDAGDRSRRVRRVEASTDFEVADLHIEGRPARSYRFDDGADPGRAEARVLDEVVTIDGDPDAPGAGAASKWVGDPIVAWCEVRARGGGVAGATDATGIDRLAQAWIDRAVALESVPGAAEVGVLAWVGGPGGLRSAVVATAGSVGSWTREVDAARAHRHAAGSCRTCEAAARATPAGIEVVHDGTCFGGLVRAGAPDGGEAEGHPPSGAGPGAAAAAWVVPWAHASSLAALTEDERLDLARAIAATLPWVARDGRAWCLAFRQAPVGDDVGDVHLVGRWFAPGDRDGDWWPWTGPTAVAAPAG